MSLPEPLPLFFRTPPANGAKN